MSGKAKQTAAWLRDVILNPDVVWVDPETGEEVSRERWNRFWGSPSRFHTLRPGWTFLFFTTREDCGCRRRFGLWRVIICYKHAIRAIEELDE